MARTIVVTPDELEAAAARIDGLAEEYKVQYDTLYNETNAMKAAWDGKDNQAFTDQIAGFKDDFERMHTLMLDYSSFLKKAARDYRETQNLVANAARRLTN